MDAALRSTYEGIPGSPVGETDARGTEHRMCDYCAQLERYLHTGRFDEAEAIAEAAERYMQDSPCIIVAGEVPAEMDLRLNVLWHLVASADSRERPAVPQEAVSSRPTFAELEAVREHVARQVAEDTCAEHERFCCPECFFAVAEIEVIE